MKKLLIKDLANYAEVKGLEEACGYIFKNKILPFTALSHSSFANEASQKNGESYSSNERLEFLGDSVLSIIISENIYMNFSRMQEGILSKMRALIVCEGSLADCAHRIGLNSIILLGSGELSNGGRNRPSILADCFEAVIGAIYLDGGLEAARSFVLRVMKDMVENSVNSYTSFDYKTTLQEILQKAGHAMPVYEVINIEGPDHDRTYTVKVNVDKMSGTGTGRSKKEAEQNSARDFIEKGYVK